MRLPPLREYETARAIALSPTQLAQLRALTDSIAVSPSGDGEGIYDLTPGSHVGALHLDDLDIVVRPKIPIDRLLFLLTYALGDVDWRAGFDLAEADDLLEAIVPAFVHRMQHALARGASQGYVERDEAALTVRGRWRVGDQVSRRFGLAPPVEVTFDDFTVDIPLNRLLLAATERLLRLPLRSERSRIGLRGVLARLEGVSSVPVDPRRIPPVRLDRRTDRFRPALALARLVLASTSFDLGHGATPATAFLVDMNKAFEDFLLAALRETLGLSERELVQGSRGHALWLDVEKSITLKPDITVWRDGRPAFVGDAKYKRLLPAGFHNADIYQATAYAVATGLPGATLVYAAGERVPGVHTVVEVGKRIRIVTLDLSGSPGAILAEVRGLADLITTELQPPLRVAV